MIYEMHHWTVAGGRRKEKQKIIRSQIVLGRPRTGGKNIQCTPTHKHSPTPFYVFPCQSPYVFPGVVCHNLIVPADENKINIRKRSATRYVKLTVL